MPLPPLPPTFLILLAASPGFGRCFALNIWIPRIENPVAPRGTPNDMCSSPPLALLTLPSIRSPSPFLLDLPLLSLLSLFFLSLLSFLELRSRRIFFFFFGKFGLNGNGISPRLLGDMDSAKERFNIRSFLYSYDSRIYLFWIQFGYRSSIRVWIFRRNLLKFEIFRFFKIEIIIMDRSIYIIVSNINVFESYTFWGFI